ncbi:Origin recognition complex, subunit 1 [Exophiala dermatitidis]|uniref:Origin recognition complex subunit 1 n=2 Tax=Exophiala dermatitidis TaxID=5970 RepID=H6C6H2_EXODN|nr:origin recognition complex subunit 1 [Exophiala dermatitidis NIH/UT8656]KAJ4522905.1 Origin recognition complex, subunit 1 [Exophiala dermatitidis]EHY59318.1 origin recognition complex subunit 1 [Exophiala dermatitidis NIH/UT8656]KAJ4526219.1 Origin recognition complex, subunit 1 [Exophiala dermatitidis]KAJ4526838.1 Origin recognition complex, subunit 1 [Exophiala dermatitidis]KAJ4532546.1 Origin recognition complex, subunit 1 [Exophiala dermatitidis]
MQRQKRYSTKGGLVRENSDDELGYDDHPWQWIYESEAGPQTKEDEEPPTKKRKANAISQTSKKRTIIGARMGSFVVRIGDPILLKSPEQGKDWVGLICSFSETNEDGDDEMCAYIQWFCTPEELAFGKRSKIRPDVLPNESYITADFNMNPLTAINGRATVLSKDAFFRRYPGGLPPKSKSGANRYSKTILCRRGVKQRTLQFTEDFVWEEIYKGPEDLLDLIDFVKEQTKGKRKHLPSKEEDKEYEQKKEADNEEPRTPHKRRKTTSTTATPKSTMKASKYTTPTHKRIMIKKPIEITPLGTRVLSPSQYLSTPYSHARTTLHVSAVPTALPCRSDEFSTVYSHLYSAIVDGSGTCIYISGTPGTGKTATVREVVASLHQAVLNEELDDFNFVEINGMKVTEPHQSYSLLWEALKGDRVSPHHALSLLEQEFSHPSPRRIPCVVLMDELDQLVTKNQSVMYNFFNWPAMRHSRLIVLAVANTMDLPERTLSNKISSRLGLTRFTFSGYTHTQLMEIISSRLQNVPGNIVDQDAVQFASRKVAAVSGDARRALDICRRAVEIAEQSQQKHEAGPTGNEDDGDDGAVAAGTPSRKGRGPANDAEQPKTERNNSSQQLARVTIATIKQAINEATSSPIAQHLRSLPLASKLFVAAILARTRRTGVAESTFGDVIVEAKRIADVAENSAIHDFLLVDGHNSEKTNPSSTMPRILALGAAAMELVEAGIVAMEARSRGERAGKVRLRVGEEEVKSALMGDADAKGMGFNA